MKLTRSCAVLLSPVLLALPASAATINIVPGATLSGNAAALGAVQRAAQAWGACIGDTTTITVNVDFGAVSGAPSSVSVVELVASYSTIRNQLVSRYSGLPGHPSAQLPTVTQFTATLPAGKALSGNLLGTKGQFKAMGFAGLDVSFGISDGAITLSNSTGFDIDHSDGVTAELFDLETLVLRDLGQILGYRSDIDFQTAEPSAEEPTVMDLYRFSASGTPNLTTSPRMLVPGTEAVFYDGTVSLRLSTGPNTTAFPSSDGNPASLWKDDAIPGNPHLGVMDPTLPPGQFYGITANDLQVLGDIGYTVNLKPIFTGLYAKNAGVPHAGSDTRIQTGAVWSSFGTPAVDGNGDVAFLGKWKAPASKTPALKAQSGTGIFVNDELLVAVGDAVSWLGGDVVFKSFKDPVIDSRGHVAFLASIKGTGVTTANDTVVVTNGRDGNLEILAREGGIAPGTGGATYKTFSSVSIQAGNSVAVTSTGISTSAISPVANSESGIVFTASLVQGAGVTSANDGGAWWLPAGGQQLQLAIREGENNLFASGSVKAFVLLKAVGGSPGQGRGQINGDTLSLFATSTDHGAGVFTVPGSGSASAGALLGDSLHSTALPNGKWAKLSLPSTDNTGAVRTLLGSLKTGAGGEPNISAKGIFQSLNGGASWEPLIRANSDAPGISSGGAVVFTSFKDPVNSPTSADVAFIGTAKGGSTPLTSTNNDGIWFYPHSGDLMLIAREGDEPPGAPGAKWKSFSSLALPGGDEGPLFTAALVIGPRGTPGPGDITSASDFGLYRADSSGSVTELVREGQPLLGKTVKSFNVLKAASGSAGTTRAFSNTHQVVLLVTFTDNTTAIVRIDLPTVELPQVPD